MSTADKNDIQSARRSLKQFAIHVLSSGGPIELQLDAKTTAGLFVLSQHFHMDIEAMVVQWVKDRLRTEQARVTNRLSGCAATCSRWQHPL